MLILSFDIDVTKRRCHIMIGTAWITAAVFAFPQTIVWRELSHPHYPNFKQCTTIGFFDSLLRLSQTSDPTKNLTVTSINETDTTKNETIEYIMSPMIAEKLYSSLFLFAVYMVPLSVIVITYVNILNKLYRKSSVNKHISRDQNEPEFDCSATKHSNKVPDEPEIQPTYLIRCLTLFRAAVRQQRFHRGGQENEDTHVKVECNQLESFDTVVKTSIPAGDNPVILLSGNSSYNGLDEKQSDVVYEDNDTTTQRRVRNCNKRKASFGSSHLESNDASSVNHSEEISKVAAFDKRLTSQNRISKSSKSSHASVQIRRNQSLKCGKATKQSSSNLVALRMCAIQVLAFIFCWTPYVSMSMVHIIGILIL